MLLPGLALSGLPVILIGDDLRAEDGIYICLLGTPMIHWFVVGLLQGRLLRESIGRPNAWAMSTWGGGSLALIAGVASLVLLTVWVDANSQAGFDPGHPFALALFGLSGLVAGLILGLIQAAAMQVSSRDWTSWLGWSMGAGALAFLLQWVGLNVIAFLDEPGALGHTHTGFLVTMAGFLLAGALVHNMLTGIALQRLLARRARDHRESLLSACNAPSGANSQGERSSKTGLRVSQPGNSDERLSAPCRHRPPWRDPQTAHPGRDTTCRFPW